MLNYFQLFFCQVQNLSVISLLRQLTRSPLPFLWNVNTIRIFWISPSVILPSIRPFKHSESPFRRWFQCLFLFAYQVFQHFFSFFKQFQQLLLLIYLFYPFHISSDFETSLPYYALFKRTKHIIQNWFAIVICFSPLFPHSIGI